MFRLVIVILTPFFVKKKEKYAIDTHFSCVDKSRQFFIKNIYCRNPFELPRQFQMGTKNIIKKIRKKNVE